MEISPAPNPAQPKSRRRWYQFGLRTLLIGVTLAGSLCGWLVFHSAQVRLVKARVRALQEYADWCKAEYTRVNNVSIVNAKGGEVDVVAFAAREMWLANADLALAQGDNHLAIDDLKNALRSAYELVKRSWGGPGAMPPGAIPEHEAYAGLLRVEQRLLELSPDAMDEVRRELGMPSN